MVRSGIIGEDDRVELLEGYIVPKMVHKPPHDGTIDLANDGIQPLLPRGWRIRIQQSIVTDDSEPEPDLAVVRGDKRTFLTRHPGPADVGLLVEVSDASLQRDRADKGRLYARARIICYWIINLIDRQVEVYTDPTGPDPSPRYLNRVDYDVNSAVPIVLSGQPCGSIMVRELLP